MTTFPGQSKYQLIVEDVAPAGAGALMAMLEKRRAALAAEGLFDADRKQAIPFLPGVIGVVTSPSGAVIRDILHRLRDRFPRHVLIWPVAVQGQACAPEVAAAIRGFNAIEPGGPVPRPDLIIVARGGGSLEDLWGFNEEIVVRAAAASRIPLISAVGHETDTTLIDFASDRRAPTPTAAAEMAVPVRLELLAAVDGLGARSVRAAVAGVGLRGQRLRDLGRALPRLESLVQGPAQRLDLWGGRLGAALGMAAARKRQVFAAKAGLVRPELLLGLVARRQRGLDERTARVEALAERVVERKRVRMEALAGRLVPSLERVIGDAERDVRKGREKLAGLVERLEAVPEARFRRLEQRLEALDRTRMTLGYAETLRRGFAVVRGDGAVVTSRAGAERAAVLEIEFADGRMTLGGKPRGKKAGEEPEQGSLF
jgi:exodeoxyribonuclease VII large subunit